MLDTFVRGFLTFGAELYLLMAFALALPWERKYEKPVRFTLLFCIGLAQGQLIAAFYYPEYLSASPLLFFGNLTLLYATVVSVYLYRWMFISEEYTLTRRHLLYLLPAAGLLFLETYVQLSGQGFRLWAVRQIMVGTLPEGVNVFTALRTGIFGLHLSFLCLFMQSQARHQSLPFTHQVFRVAVGTAVVGLVSAVFLVSYMVFDKPALFKAAMMMLNAMVIVLLVIVLRFPHLLEMVKDEMTRGRYQRSRLEGVDTESLGESLVRLMEEEHLYRQENLSLARLARSLNVSPHQLSEYLNNECNTNFRRYINTFRIEHAKRMLLENPGETILNIAFAAGFNSQSTFYSAFTKQTGMTPNRFRKQETAAKN